ncbi:MAG: hypothetical protein JSW30_05160 [Dehalococcoidia bacterium]|nr:MAG: hypothetical protein JSW30_05160 [Dehalococcoidia bacterium]
MKERICQTCGCSLSQENLVRHRIIPESVATGAGISGARTVALCPNCSQEVQNWYAKKVLHMNYDEVTRRFKPKSPAELVKEYEGVYKTFVRYKKVALKI